MPNFNLHRVDLNLLVVFDAIVKSGSVKAAADRLALSQPAVSHALARLRRIVDDPLFVRSGHSLVSTPRAEALAGQVDEVLQLVRACLATGAFAPRASERRFRVCASDFARLVIVPPLARALCAEAPLASLEIHAPGAGAAARMDVLGRLGEGGLDCALLFAPPPTPYASCEVLRDRCVGLVATGHPLATKAAHGAVTLDDYLFYPHIATDAGEDRGAVDAALDLIGRPRRIALSVDSFAAGVETLKGADLVMTSPSLLTRGRPGLVAFDLPVPTRELSCQMIWHRRAENDQIGRASCRERVS
jgi:DNA-binding transcriptional LysR family regulator